MVAKFLKPKASFLKVPYPYKTLLSIESDIDGATIENTLFLAKFLSDLDWSEPWLNKFSNSIWLFKTLQNNQNGVAFLDGEDDQATPTKDHELLIELAHLGLFSSMHSFGTFKGNFSRRAAEFGCNWANLNNLRFDIFSNHGGDHSQNIMGNRYPSLNTADTPKSDTYIIDLINLLGIKYFWIGGSNAGTFGYNDPIQIRELKDGTKAQEFFRYNLGEADRKSVLTAISYGAKRIRTSKEKKFFFMGWNPSLINFQFNENKIEDNERPYIILGQHLNNIGFSNTISEQVASKLKKISDLEIEQKLLMVRTSDLLNYYNLVKYSSLVIESKGEFSVINLKIPAFTPQGFWITNPRMSLSLKIENIEINKPIKIIYNNTILNHDEFYVSHKGRGFLIINIKGYQKRRNDEAIESMKIINNYLSNYSSHFINLSNRKENFVPPKLPERTTVLRKLFEKLKPQLLRNADPKNKKNGHYSRLIKYTIAVDKKSWGRLLSSFKMRSFPRKLYVSDEILCSAIGFIHKNNEVLLDFFKDDPNHQKIISLLMLASLGYQYVSIFELEGILINELKFVNSRQIFNISHDDLDQKLIDILSMVSVENWED